ISFTVLEVAFQFDPRGDNSPEALVGLLYTYCLGTALGLFCAFLPLIRYPLDKTLHAQIRRELDARAK
ncbi:MAG: sodium:melibiose symporter, partial [Gammaproteobacteria bacterium]